MSVGRVEMWNYKGNSNIHSWASAFSILDENPWSIKQLKALDRHRQKVLHRTDYFLAKMKCPAIKKSTNKSDFIGTMIAYRGKPYSYNGQCFTYKYSQIHWYKWPCFAWTPFSQMRQSYSNYSIAAEQSPASSEQSLAGYAKRNLYNTIYLMTSSKAVSIAS